ncbi:Chromatin structure-remodeling complex subunit rsc4 [Colletotrichum sp. SAR 10_70]|nr:Chromatin structure-remodeling complex subunit rsc4 [Colletotrichum sp. SAR 10_71]KAI8153609.1 Chromatin structure-remodeling complex subunit rsc4 [Colletotrichum sp. SAR 10_70]KAI8172790.1 Chromatin structure-remodeling complex subunit rsc4 [Colletotrichum sp. SAR 10_75]KAJ4995079.1 Chromatin structure-remodeling complex subunit rsc4 [Colletotrichum sp. SAR 10_66]
MDHKRKSSAANGATEGADERAAKRLRLSQKYNLSKQETVESTTEHGLFFLEQIRQTKDKNGRLVAGYFEKLPSKESTPEYYKKTRMPISLSMIERKLKKGDFSTLTELESYFKRMVTNAKEFYPRNTQIFDDAERVRKALSNYMTKTNPAYNGGNYSAVPTPLPASGVVDEVEEEDEDDATPAKTGRRKSQGNAKPAEKQPEVDEGDEDEDEDAEEDEDEEDEDEDDDAEGEEDDDEEASQSSKRAAIIIRRRGPGRPPKGVTPRKSKGRTSTPSRPDCEYEDVPYKGLTFQAAQEKIVEEMLRKREDEPEAYFEPFVNLPPRALKDYYRVIKEPISIKKLQKSVKGVKGRNEATGTSEFKNWAAFEESASLLWKNACFYNEEGKLTSVKEFFLDELKQAKAVVPEPSQPKIKLKVQQPAAEQPTTSKKITIHVGGKSDSADSPAPPVPQSAGSQASEQIASNGTTRQAANPIMPAAMDRIRSTSAASPSPSVANTIKREDVMRPSPAGIADALISSLKVQTHPMINHDRRFEVTVKPLEKVSQQSVTVHMPANQLRIQIVPTLPAFLEKEGRQYRLWVIINRHTLTPVHGVPGQVLSTGERVFEAQLQAGIVNTIEVHVVAALPKGQKLPSGEDFEVEQMTVLANVVRN